MEKKFQDALAFKDQTGQGILDEAETQHQALVEEGNNSEAEDVVAMAKTKKEGMLTSVYVFPGLS